MSYDYLKVDLVGPFVGYHVVVVNGRAVPHLTATPDNGGVVWLSVDNRSTLDIPVADFDRTAAFIADCIAVAAGYTGHPSADQEPVKLQPFPRMIELSASVQHPTEEQPTTE